MLAGGDSLAPYHHGRIHRRISGVIVVIPGAYHAGDCVLPAPHIPHGVLRAVIQAGWLTVWHADAEHTVKLAVANDESFQLRHRVHFCAKPDTHFRENALNKFQIGFPPLGDEFPLRIRPLQTEIKIRPFQAVRTQYLLQQFRHREILVNRAAAGQAQ